MVISVLPHRVHPRPGRVVYAENIYERISVDLGAADHITKPFHPVDLVEKIRTLLRVTT